MRAGRNTLVYLNASVVSFVNSVQHLASAMRVADARDKDSLVYVNACVTKDVSVCNPVRHLGSAMRDAGSRGRNMLV